MEANFTAVIAAFISASILYVASSALVIGSTSDLYQKYLEEGAKLMSFCFNSSTSHNTRILVESFHKLVFASYIVSMVIFVFLVLGFVGWLRIENFEMATVRFLSFVTTIFPASVIFAMIISGRSVRLRRTEDKRG